MIIVCTLAVLSSTNALAQVTEFADVTLGSARTPVTEQEAVQMPAEAGKPVQWVKEISVVNAYDQSVSLVTVTIPADASDVQVVDVTGARNYFEMEGNEVTITDQLAFNEQKKYMIKYTTPAPDVRVTTEVVKDGAIAKNVIVSSDNHYLDVLTYTEVPDLDDAGTANVRLYWYIDGVKSDVTDDELFDIKFHDSDGDGLYDMMSWVTPHLSTQIFEVTILSEADAGSYTHIGLRLLSPPDADYIESTGRIGFNYSVQYNSSTSVLCNLTIDSAVVRAGVTTTTDVLITDYHNLSSGGHTWSVSCAGSDGSTNTSETRSFTVDVDAPAVSLNTPDYHASNTDSIQLNFTATDTEDATLVCSLSVNGALNRTGISVDSGTQETVTLTGLPNGIYDWNASCADSAGNLGRSEERVFYISEGTPSDFSIEPNKDEYSLGQTGYMIINARPGSNLTMFVSAPLSESFFKYYNGMTFPIVDMINFTNNVGTYNIDGIFSHAGETYIVKTSFIVSNTFNCDIEANDTTGEPTDIFNFKASSNGGIGAVTYEWDFDDGSTTTGDEVDHVFSEKGDYSVKLTATDSKGNKVTDTADIKVYNKYSLTVTVKELQTQKLLDNVTVEVDDERKEVDSQGKAVFTVYEGRRRIYIAEAGYEYFKRVINVTADTEFTAEINNTAITNYTPSPEPDGQVTAEADEAESQAELLLAQIETALSTLEGTDQATKAAIEILGIEARLQTSRKEIRHIIRDIGMAELDEGLTDEEKSAKISNITQGLDKYRSLVLGIEVTDTTEYVDYPKTADISLLSTEYLNFVGGDYSKRQEADYIDTVAELQDKTTIKTRLIAATLTTLNGRQNPVSLVINRIEKKPDETTDMFFLEYIPKEAAQSSDDISPITEFSVIKKDPILRFTADIDEYAYSIGKTVSIEDLRKTKHALMTEPEPATGGIAGVTGMSFMPDIKIENPKLAIEIAVIVLLLLAYLVYHFELIDRVNEWRTAKKKGYAPYETDMAYKPESSFESMTRKVKSFVNREEDLIANELSHIRSLILTAHSHVESSEHHKAGETYSKIKEHYSSLSTQAKKEVHEETKEVFSKVLLAKADHLINEAESFILNNEHTKARVHYSEIKRLYSQLEKEHRAAISERCFGLHEKLFGASLT